MYGKDHIDREKSMVNNGIAHAASFPTFVQSSKLVMTCAKYYDAGERNSSA